MKRKLISLSATDVVVNWRSVVRSRDLKFQDRNPARGEVLPASVQGPSTSEKWRATTPEAAAVHQIAAVVVFIHRGWQGGSGAHASSTEADTIIQELTLVVLLC